MITRGQYSIVYFTLAVPSSDYYFVITRPQVPQHFQSCLLWHQIDEVIAVRQEQIQQQLPAERTAAVPYENRIHLRKEDTLVSNLFGSSTQGTHSKQIERCKQSFEDFAQLRAPDLDRSPKESINGTPDRVAVIALREAPHIVMSTFSLLSLQSPTLTTSKASKAVNIQDIVGKIEASRRRGCTGCHHGYLTSEHPSYRPSQYSLPPEVFLNSSMQIKLTALR